MSNPLIDDRFVDFLLHEVHDAEGLLALPAFADHGRDTFDLYVANARRIAREALFPSYRALDQEPPAFANGVITTHPSLPPLYAQIVELGCIAATRPFDAGGQQLPQLVACLAHAYLMAGNLSVYCYAGLTAGAAHLIEAFGSTELNDVYRAKMLDGTWTGTMALTEPQAGSSLADVATRATPAPDGTYRIRGSKIFISGGDHTMAENVVHLALARIDGAPAGTKGISLFVVPKLRPEGDRLVPNDVTVAGMIHKIGWKGLPSLALEFGDAGDCHGYLLGEPNQGLRMMFQMMNEARLMVGVNGASTASVAYHESRLYALTRPQGRKGTVTGPQVPIVEHADVRRMLLRQKAIVEGALALLAATARYADVAEHGTTDTERERAQLLVDLLTPLAKSFPAEKGFEANALAVQILGGYGYTSEYLPEAFLRDQKLNSIHEGTTGIQSLDLLGRKVAAKGGAAIAALGEAVGCTLADAKALGLDEEHDLLARGLGIAAEVTAELGKRGASGDAEGMMAHSVDYLDLVCTFAIGWQWLVMRVAAERLASRGDTRTALIEGVRAASRYWLRTEVPRIGHLGRLCTTAEDSYLRVRPEWL